MNDSNTSYWVYVLENPHGQFYIGYTDNLNRRITEHNDAQRGRKTHTHKHGPWTLAWSEPHADRASAMARERSIKSMKSAQWIRQHLLNR